MTTSYQLFQKDASVCIDLINHYGSNYKFATLFFPRNMRIATYVLYAFLRYTDEIVDEIDISQTNEERYEQLDAWYTDVAQKHNATSPIARAFWYIAEQYHFQDDWALDFLRIMKQDLSVARYETYADTEAYMYGSAVVVGHMMTHIIGFDTSIPASTVYAHARSLGEAMQLANFLRDIKEDVLDRSRVYLPQEDLHTYGITIDHLLADTYDGQTQKFMKYQIQRCRALFDHAHKGIRFLHRAGRPAVAASSIAYERILDLIENNNYVADPQRCHVSSLYKLWSLIRAYLGIY